MNLKDAFLQKIKAHPVPKQMAAFYIDGTEQQLIDNRNGPRLKPLPKRVKSPDQTSWLSEKDLSDGSNT